MYTLFTFLLLKVLIVSYYYVYCKDFFKKESQSYTFCQWRYLDSNSEMMQSLNALASLLHYAKAIILFLYMHKHALLHRAVESPRNFSFIPLILRMQLQFCKMHKFQIPAVQHCAYTQQYHTVHLKFQQIHVF